jgi:murein DD-endopeptidase MepM/ murein hydrolase activator NlpD
MKVIAQATLTAAAAIAAVAANGAVAAIAARAVIPGVAAHASFSTTLAAPSRIDVQLESRAQQPGELVVLTLTLPEQAAPPRVQAFGRNIPVYAVQPSAAKGGEATWRALVGIDLDMKPGTYTVIVNSAKDSSVGTERELVIGPKTFPTRKLTVDQAFVTPPQSEQARIAADAKLLEQTWRSSPPDRLWSGPFVRPVPQEANSRFGSRSIFNGKKLNPHGGADFMSPAGTPVHAPNAGRVVVARNLYFSGNTVIIDHGLGLFSTLAHFSEIDVREGDRVEAGAVVGKVGATGRVTGPHLHWAVRANDARIDPIAVLALLGSRSQ